MKFSQSPTGEWRATVRIKNGKTRTVRLYTKDKAEAEQLAEDSNLAQVERLAVADLLTRSLIRQMTRDGVLTVKNAIIKWSEWLLSSGSGNSAHNMLTYAKAWMRDTHCARLGMDEISEDDIARWVNKPDGCKINTRRFRLATLRSLFWYCKTKEFIDVDVSLLVGATHKDLAHEAREGRTRRCFTDEEYNRLIIHLKSKERYKSFWLPAVVIGRNSALRLGDIAELQWASIKETFVVHTNKRNKRIEHPMTDELKQSIALIEKLDDKWCFPAEAKINQSHKHRVKLSIGFWRILKAAGINGLSFHSLRSTKLTELDRGGMPMDGIARFAGHSSTKTTEIYIEKI